MNNQHSKLDLAMQQAQPATILEECRADCIAADTCCNANVGNPSLNSGCGQGSCLQACILLRTDTVVEGTNYYQDAAAVAGFCNTVVVAPLLTVGAVVFSAGQKCDHGAGAGVAYGGCPVDE